MWTDRILALVSLALLLVFLGVLVVYVRRVDLTIVIGVVAAMAIYDFYRELWADHLDAQQQERDG